MSTSDLAPAFTLADARASGLRKDQVYEMLSAGTVERVGRGVYLRPAAIDPALAPLVAATAVRSEATMCLTSSLVHHELSDVIPAGIDIALPRGMRSPAGFEHVVWHHFEPATFAVGRESYAVTDDVSVGIYSAERTIVDCFRLMYREGSDVAYEALRRWLRRRGSSPSALLEVAARFPKAERGLRHALEVLL